MPACWCSSGARSTATRGSRNTIANTDINSLATCRREGLKHKLWFFTLGFGGSSSCWTGCVPRMLPNDFAMRSQYGAAEDWPFTYDELEPHYGEVEAAMAVSGSPDYDLGPRSTPFPQPPHNLCEPELALQKAYPGKYFPQATARARRPVGNRPGCCASAHCVRCPVNAKFTVLNSMARVYADPRVSVMIGAKATRLDIQAGRVTGVHYRGRDGAEQRTACDFVGLGANALLNAALLLRSSLAHPLLGRRLHEQMSVQV